MEFLVMAVLAELEEPGLSLHELTEDCGLWLACFHLEGPTPVVRYLAWRFPEGLADSEIQRLLADKLKAELTDWKNLT